MRRTTTLIHSAGVVDGDRVGTPPGSGGALLVETRNGRCSVLAAGALDRVESHPAAPVAERRDLPDAVLIPSLVNAHTHLDLTHLGPRPFDTDRGFAGWLGSIRDERLKPHDAAASLRLGCRLLRDAGVSAVGDILGFDAWAAGDGLRVLGASGLEGVAFLEVFGTGSRQQRAIDAMHAAIGPPTPPREGRPGVRIGVQPHAPYSTGPDVYRAAAALARTRGVPVATHIGESLAEHQFVADAAGPLRAMIEELGLWESASEAGVGQGCTPVAHVAESLDAPGWLAVHVNDCSDEDLRALAASGAHLVYCPRASAYFAHEEHFGPHRYRDMARAGINVALGTDSIVCLPDDESGRRLSPLDEMRFLWARDGGVGGVGGAKGADDARGLLAMGTINGARALGLDERRYTFDPGDIAGIIAIDVAGTREDHSPEARVMEARSAPQWIWPQDEAP